MNKFGPEMDCNEKTKKKEVDCNASEYERDEIGGPVRKKIRKN